MNKNKRSLMNVFGRIGALLVVLALLAGSFGQVIPALASTDRPSGASQADTPNVPNPAIVEEPYVVLPATTCTYTLATNTRACSLFAKTGTVTLNNAATTAPIWGYSTTLAGAATLAGSTLIVKEGEIVQITLTNNLAQATSLNFIGLDIIPDNAPVAPGASKTYTFTATQTGTFLFEAGMTPGVDGYRQVMMGLMGVLIVRPASYVAVTNQIAYTGGEKYDDEAILVFSEIDPAFNAAPDSFVMYNFAPKYFFTNGKLFPYQNLINTLPGRKVLLRIVNAGGINRSIGVLGMSQKHLAVGGVPLQYPYTSIAETISAGAVRDSLVTIPVTAVAGQRFAIYDASMVNLNTNGFTLSLNNYYIAGALSYMRITGTLPAATGPIVSTTSVTPASSNGSVNLTINAVVTDVATGNQNITDAEYFIDTLGAAGTGIKFTSGFGAPTASVSATITGATLTGLSTGQHFVYVRGFDTAWGPANSAVFSIDKSGPESVSLSLTPAVTNSTVPVAIQATADETLTGYANILAAEYFINPTGAEPVGSGTPLLVTLAPSTSYIASLTGIIAPATLAALPEGMHSLQVRSQDALGNWGGFGSVSLKLDKTGPATSAVLLSPNPFVTANSNLLRVEGTFNDPLSGAVNSSIVTAEIFLEVNNPALYGTGVPMMSKDGLFDSISEIGYADIPLAQLQNLSQGTHTVYVHAKDAAGNWGPMGSAVLTLDKSMVDTTGPLVGNLAVSPNPSLLATVVTLTGNAADLFYLSNIGRVEFFLDGIDPGVGLATAATLSGTGTLVSFSAAIDISTLSRGTHTITVRAKDTIGATTNWGAVATITFTRTDYTYVVYVNTFLVVP